MCVCVTSERVKHQYKGLKKSVVKPIFLRLFFDKVINKNKKQIGIEKADISNHGICQRKNICFLFLFLYVFQSLSKNRSYV